MIGDYNGDGKPDIVTFNIYSNSFSVLLNLGSGKLAPAVSYKADVSSLYFTGQQVFGGDLNGDKKADLAIAFDDFVTTITAQPRGTFHVAPQRNSLRFLKSLRLPSI